jgi:competence protein ComEC
VTAASAAESDRPGPQPRSRAPAVSAAVAVVAGVLVDRRLPFDWTTWLVVCGGAIAVWIVMFSLRWNKIAAASLMLALFCVGGGRHHQSRSVAPHDDVSRFARTESTPVRLIARIKTPPVVVPRSDDPLQSAWDQPDRTFVLVECESVASKGGGAKPVSGVVRVQVSGHLLHVQPGDRVEIRGWLSRPSGPQNPGEDDFRDRLLRFGAKCIVFTGDPDAVKRIDGSRWTVRRPLARFRQRAEELLAANLNDRPLAVGSAMLLGDRTHLENDLRLAFAQSGMMHVLAISGLHVGMLALFLWCGARVLRLPTVASTAVVLGGVVLYALITDVRPSIVRATIVIAVVVLGRAGDRRTSTLNALAIAAMLIVLWNPADLFDVGAQLSFLSVLGLVAAGTWLSSRPRDESLEESVGTEGVLRKWAKLFGGWLWRMQVAMAFIWLFAAPLVAARFHVVSPVGLILNTVLLPGLFLVLLSGYALVFAGLLLPALQHPTSRVFDASLRVMLDLIDWGSSLHLGHFYVPGPSDWWLGVYYALLAGVAFAAPVAGRIRSTSSEASNARPRRPAIPPPPRLRFRRWLWCAILGWMAVGLALSVRPPKTDGLRCTFLSLGHGIGVLIELPDGRTLLYDAGSIGNGRRATRTVQSALWDRGKSRIDAVIVSHADIDHFNGAPELIRTVPVGTLIVAKSFLGPDQWAAQSVVDVATQRGVPLRFVRSGDVLSAGESVSIRVLHPDEADYESDNAASIVLEIEYAGRRVLLTGDLEKDGLDRLLSTPGRPVDVLLSPHHGSRLANPPELVDWAQPSHVVASAGRQLNLPALRAAYGDGPHVVSTFSSGAVTATISPRGELSVREFAKP